MSNIEQNLKKIKTARYGEDVRDAIHDSIEDCYNDGKAGAIDLSARASIEALNPRVNSLESEESATARRVTALEGALHDLDPTSEPIAQYTSMMEQITSTKDAYIDMSSRIGAGEYIIKHANVDGTAGNVGVIISTSGALVEYDLHVFQVFPGEVISEITTDPIQVVYAFYSGMPDIGSASIDGTRPTSSAHTVNNVTVPAGANWIAIRTNLNGVVVFDKVPHIEQMLTEESEALHDFVTSYAAEKEQTYNIWPGDESYSFAERVYIYLDTPIPAGDYIFHAKVVSSDTDSPFSLISFRNESAAITTLTVNRNAEINYIVSLDSDCVQVRFFASNVDATSSGDTATFSDIMLISGTGCKRYIPPTTAADYVARSYTPELLDVSNKILADTTYWTQGSINDTPGCDTTNATSIKTRKYIKVDPSKPVYFQAYYETPTTLTAVADTENYNIRNGYVVEYNEDLMFIKRTTLTSTQTIYGVELSLDKSCAYIRLSLYTRLGNSDIETIMPGTIFFDQVDDEFWLPPYYDYYLESKAQVIEEYARAAGGDGNVFIFITDEHAPTYNVMRSPALIHRLSELVHIPLLFSGGNVAQSGKPEQEKEYCDALRHAFGGRIHHAVGRNDFLNKNLGQSLYYDMDMYNTDQIGSSNHHYYYVDDPQHKTRYLVLATFRESPAAMGTGDSTNPPSGCSQEQYDWVKNVALDIPSGWSIVVFGNYFYHIDPSTKECTLNSGPAVLNWLKDNQAVIAVFQGYTHFDRVIKGLDIRSGDLPVISTVCDKNTMLQNFDEGWTINRATGTINEQAFDVVIVNKATKTINLVRIGAPAENGVNNDPGVQAEVRTVSYDRQVS